MTKVSSTAKGGRYTYSPALPLYQPRGVYTDGSGTRSHGALFASILIYSMFYSSELTQVYRAQQTVTCYFCGAIHLTNGCMHELPFYLSSLQFSFLLSNSLSSFVRMLGRPRSLSARAARSSFFGASWLECVTTCAARVQRFALSLCRCARSASGDAMKLLSMLVGPQGEAFDTCHHALHAVRRVGCTPVAARA